MKAFVLRRVHWEYDEVEAIAVVAADEAEARRVASETRDPKWDSTGPEWLDPAKSTIEEISLEAPGVVMEHLHYG